MKCFEVLRGEICGLVSGVFHSGDLVDIRFRPSVPWELREEYFRIYFLDHKLHIEFVDPVDSSALLLRGDFLLDFKYSVRNYSLDVENYFADGSVFEYREDIEKKLSIRIDTFIKRVSSIDSPDGLIYGMSKWIVRPSNPFLIQWMLDHCPEAFVMKMADVLGCSSLCKALIAARKLVR